jgi:glycosyltransferase involved in cell wall biosynthesis
MTKYAFRPDGAIADSPDLAPPLKEQPVVSVILPVYNAEAYLRAAIDSILAQTFPDFELLTLDDGSTDGSLAILRGYAASDPRVRVVSRENRGLVATLNELIAISKGRYLARMDADDLSRPQRLEKQVAYLESHPDCLAVGTQYLLVDPHGNPLCESANEITHEEIEAAHFATTQGRICHPRVAMRKDAVVQVGGYRSGTQFAEDLDLFLRLGEIGKLTNLPDVLFEYRHHLNSICYSRWVEQRTVAQGVVAAARARRGLPPVPQTIEFASVEDTTPEIYRKWAWWALSAGNVGTARRYAFKALALAPLNIENLHVAACAIRGH